MGAADFARKFIAGSNYDEVVRAARQQRDQQKAFTLDILGEAVISYREADDYLKAYVDLLNAVSSAVNAWPHNSLLDEDDRGPIPRANLSIKLSALDCHFYPLEGDQVVERVGKRLKELLRVARRNKAFINVDMESYEKKDLTLRIFQEVLMDEEFRDWADIGIVIQCYLRDSGADFVKLRDWARRRGTPVWVRLVKGAYWDYETIHARAQGWPIPVYSEKHHSDANYERQLRFVLQNIEYLRPAIGSHNMRSIAYGIAVAEHLGLPKNAFEVQMLYGMADAEKTALIERGHRLRVYMPYGDLIPGMAYLVRRLLENTSNDSFLRAGMATNVDVERLLTDPNEKGPLPTSPHEANDEHSSNMGNEMTTATTPAASLKCTFRNEPPIDFSKADQRQAMTAALQTVRSQLGKHFPMVIDGKPVDTSDRIESNNPANLKQIVGTTAVATPQHVDQAVAVAKAAMPKWASRSATDRAAFLRKAAQVMRDRFFELSAWQVFECGKQWNEATNDVCEAIDFCEYYAQGAIELEQPTGADVPGEENRFDYLPRGVCAVIAPWNFPLAILTGMVTAALATGNTVVFKPAEQSSVSGALLMEILTAAGLPPGVANFLPGHGRSSGARMVEHPDVALIAFTGSRQVGLAINSKAAEVSASGIPIVKRVIAEMGGKNALIIDVDADLDEAVVAVVRSAFGYQGQKCSACSRAIVLAPIYDAFVHRLAEAVKSLVIAPAEDPASNVGAVIDDDARQKIQSYIDLGRKEGREIVSVDVGELAKHGSFVGPHVFADVPPNARIAQEEIFGPVLAVIKCANLDQAFQIANGTDYALTGGMFSRSPQSLARAKRELLVGNVYLNRNITGALVCRQPFGGFKMSGIGSKAGGKDYLLQFVVPRTITENTMRRGFAPSLD
jgi:RHH-type proline utilization regulon transcriptional repressor/proline dehydrogenase/delta 1-pyrroline-5-carboxylate dehydrogenase